MIQCVHSQELLVLNYMYSIYTSSSKATIACYPINPDLSRLGWFFYVCPLGDCGYYKCFLSCNDGFIPFNQLLSSLYSTLTSDNFRIHNITQYTHRVSFRSAIGCCLPFLPPTLPPTPQSYTTSIPFRIKIFHT